MNTEQSIYLIYTVSDIIREKQLKNLNYQDITVCCPAVTT